MNVSIKFLSLIAICCLASMPASAEWAQSLPVGASLPTFEVADQNGKTWDNQNIIAENGAILFISRSTVW